MKSFLCNLETVLRDGIHWDRLWMIIRLRFNHRCTGKSLISIRKWKLETSFSKIILMWLYRCSSFEVLQPSLCLSPRLIVRPVRILWFFEESSTEAIEIQFFYYEALWEYGQWAKWTLTAKRWSDECENFLEPDCSSVCSLWGFRHVSYCREMYHWSASLYWRRTPDCSGYWSRTLENAWILIQNGIGLYVCYSLQESCRKHFSSLITTINIILLESVWISVFDCIISDEMVRLSHRKRAVPKTDLTKQVKGGIQNAVGEPNSKVVPHERTHCVECFERIVTNWSDKMIHICTLDSDLLPVEKNSSLIVSCFARYSWKLLTRFLYSLQFYALAKQQLNTG